MYGRTLLSTCAHTFIYESRRHTSKAIETGLMRPDASSHQASF